MVNLMSKISSFIKRNISRKSKIEFEAEKIYSRYKRFTMIPKDLYIDNLLLAKKFAEIPGEIVECGVWKGGMIAGISEFIGRKKANLFDSYQGLPLVREIDGEAAWNWQNNPEGEYFYDNCSADEKYAIEAMELSGVEYTSYKGWFKDVFNSSIPIESISILRLDSDWYDSTLECLEFFYPKITSGGLVIIDDYLTWEGCSKAVHDYLSKIKSKSSIRSTSLGLIYIIKLD